METEYARIESNVEARSEASRIDGQAIKTHYARFSSNDALLLFINFLELIIRRFSAFMSKKIRIWHLISRLSRLDSE